MLPVSGIKVMVVDDHTVVRSGLSLLLRTQPDIEVVGLAGSADQAIDLARAKSPDVVLLDITMPGKSGLDALPELLQVSPDTRVIILTMHDDQAYVGRALGLGASGYLLKSAADEELVDAIRTVHGGRSFISITLGDNSLRGVLKEGAPGTVGARESPGLSDREREVLGLIGRGHTNREIAEKTSLSVKSVETYRTRIAHKLGIRKRAELVRYAIENGLLEAES